MEKFIALALVILLLVAFPMQYAVQQKNHYNISKLQTIVDSAKEQAAQKGYFDTAVKAQMVQSISEQWDIGTDEIIVNTTQAPKYRTTIYDERELISYEVGVPIDKIIAANSLFGISAEDNKTVYYIRGNIASELLQEIAP